MEDQNVERNTDSGGLAPEVSEGGKVSIGNGLAFVHAIPAKNLASFCPCSEDLNDAELKRNRLIYLEEAILRQSGLAMGIAHCSHLGLQ